MAAAILLFVTLLAPLRILASFRTEGKWNKDIDRDGDGQPEVLRTASNLPVYPGTRCGENFAGLERLSSLPSANDAMLCVGKPIGNAKEQDGDLSLIHI